MVRRNWCCLLVAAVLGFSNVSWAQDKPCTHGSTSIKMGGVDVSEMRCRLAVQQDMIVELQGQLVVARSGQVMAANDLSAQKAEQDKRNTDLDAWFAAYFGTKPAAQ